MRFSDQNICLRKLRLKIQHASSVKDHDRVRVIQVTITLLPGPPAISRIRVPEKYRADLPKSVHVKTGFATFDKTYRFDGNDIVVERTITVLKKKVASSESKAYQSFTMDISLEGEAWIQLTRGAITPADESESGQTSVSPPANDAGATTVQLNSSTKVVSGESSPDTSPEDAPPPN